ncbi:MAG: MFS transporter [Alphaproteobacteria bacterium]|nr:MFS transporter [Alphaproteobacteria bacterium]
MPAPSEKSPSVATILWVFVPFASAYFLSYVFRTVNAVIAPDLVRDIGLDAEDLGLLTSAYFLTFALFQLPLGLLLDRYGPRRVEAWLLLIAGTGGALFAFAEGLAALAVARALIGLGVSSCLMAGFKAFVLWLPRHRQPLANGALVAVGGLGAIVATMPAEFAVGLVGWRALFGALAALTIGAAALIYLVVPERAGQGPSGGVGDQVAGLATILGSRTFWRLTPLAATVHAGFLGIQSLWAGPWLRDVAGLDRAGVADHLLTTAAAVVVGSLGIGALASRLERRGIPLLAFVTVGAGLLIAVQLSIALEWAAGWARLAWAAFGFCGGFGALYYAELTRAFPGHLAGRVVTSVNFLTFLGAFVVQYGVGWIIDLFPPTGGGYAPESYGTAFGLVIAAQVLAFAWFLFAGRRR